MRKQHIRHPPKASLPACETSPIPLIFGNRYNFVIIGHECLSHYSEAPGAKHIACPHHQPFEKSCLGLYSIGRSWGAGQDLLYVRSKVVNYRVEFADDYTILLNQHMQDVQH